MFNFESEINCVHICPGKLGLSLPIALLYNNGHKVSLIHYYNENSKNFLFYQKLKELKRYNLLYGRPTPYDLFEDKFYYRVSLPLIFNRFNGEVKELILDPEPAQKLELERLSIISNYVLLNIVKKQKKAFREFHQKMKSINIGGV